MSERFNAARRVRNILTEAKSHSQDESALSVWIRVFGTENVDNRSFETVRLLGLLDAQVDAIRSEIQQTDLNSEDYEVTFRNLAEIIRIDSLNSQWAAYRQNITGEVVRQLGMFSQMLPVDEQVIPEEDFEQLSKELHEFQDEVLQSNMDVRLKRFVLKQINIILKAMREYPIRGADAIKDGDEAILAAALSEHDLVQEHKDENVVKKTGGFWKRFRRMSASVNINIDPVKLLTSNKVQKVIEAGSDVADKINQ